MTTEYYHMESKRLREVLHDAVERGDYYLEFDTREALVALMDRYYEREE